MVAMQSFISLSIMVVESLHKILKGNFAKKKIFLYVFPDV
jgi:hypothetical protein